MRSILVLLAVAGCSAAGRDTVATGSSTMVVHGAALYSVNPWDGTLVRADPAARRSLELELGGEPTRIAVAGDELWVTLRAERAVVVFRPRSEGLPEEVARVSVGAEPYGVVASPDGAFVYVAVSQQDEVVEIERATREVTRTFLVGDDPRWLAVHPSGDALYVAYAFGDRWTRIDLRTGETGGHELPPTITGDGRATPLAGRATGDPSVSAAGDLLVVPTLYVDNLTAGAQPGLDGDRIDVPRVPYYVDGPSTGRDQVDVGRLNPSVVVIALDGSDGAPRPEREPLAVTIASADRRGLARGAIGSAIVDPDGERIWTTSESAHTVGLVDLWPVSGQGSDRSIRGGDGLRGEPAFSGFTERAQVAVRVGSGPSGLVVGADGLLRVHERWDRRVGRIDTEEALASLEDARRNDLPAYSYLLEEADGFGAGTSHLDPDVEAGRRLFGSATDGRVTAAGAAVACATCHVDGRNDGLTWAFGGHARQTPSLVGAVQTTPVTWTDGVETVGQEALITALGRMGGIGLSAEEADQIEAFVATLRDVDLPDRDRTDDEVRRGAALFASPEVGCAECHDGPRFTDNEVHAMFGAEVNTPGLVGVASTPPYLHDGSSRTLRALLERLRDGEMGSTAGLSDADLDALEAYLRSL